MGKLSKDILPESNGSIVLNANYFWFKKYNKTIDKVLRGKKY